MRTRNCDLTGKTANRKARVVTFSHTRNHKVRDTLGLLLLLLIITLGPTLRKMR
jgi:hypothetical protein